MKMRQVNILTVQVWLVLINETHIQSADICRFLLYVNVVFEVGYSNVSDFFVCKFYRNEELKNGIC